MSPTVTDYSGHCRTLLPVREIDLKARALLNLNQLIRSDWNLNADPCWQPVQLQHTLCQITTERLDFISKKLIFIINCSICYLYSTVAK